MISQIFPNSIFFGIPYYSKEEEKIKTEKKKRNEKNKGVSSCTWGGGPKTLAVGAGVRVSFLFGA